MFGVSRSLPIFSLNRHWLKLKMRKDCARQVFKALLAITIVTFLLNLPFYYFRKMGSPLSHYERNKLLSVLEKLHEFTLDCNLEEIIEDKPCICPSDIKYTSACTFIVETNVNTKLCNKKQRQLSAKNPKCSSLLQCQEIPILFKQAMLQTDINLYLDLLKVFSKTLEEAHIHYIVAGGTVLGSLRHHGFIPWDDDIDVYVPLEQKNKMLEALKPLEPLYLTAHRRKQLIKFFSSKSKRVKRLNYGWPQIDIFFYISKSNHLQFQLLPIYMTDPVLFSKKYIFPRKKRPFCDMTVYVPNKPMEYLEELYPGFDMDICVSRSLNHRRNEPMNKTVTGSTTYRCNEFNHIYPYVVTEKYNNTHVMEKTFIGKKEVNSVILTK